MPWYPRPQAISRTDENQVQRHQLLREAVPLSINEKYKKSSPLVLLLVYSSRLLYRHYPHSSQVTKKDAGKLNRGAFINMKHV